MVRLSRLRRRSGGLERLELCGAIRYRCLSGSLGLIPNRRWVR